MESNLLRILLVTEKGVILNDEYTNKVITIKSLSFIEGFELEKKFDSLEKNQKYLIEQK